MTNLPINFKYQINTNNLSVVFNFELWVAKSRTVGQGSATPGTRAKRGTRADFLWHTK